VNAIIFRYYHINGALLDVLEYYFRSQALRKSTQLILIIKRGRVEDIYRIIEDRYNLPPDFNYKKNIFLMESEYKLIYHKFDNILILDYGTTGVLSYTLANHYHLIYDHDKRYIEKYKTWMEKKNFTVYNEMPFGMGNIQYKMKFLFEWYKFKESEQCEPNCLINASGKSSSELDRALKLTDKRLLITGDSFIEENERIRVLRKHPNNFFDLWDTYMYIHDGKYFEPRCRLLMEAYFMGKNIIYNNIYGVRDGSWYRYKELIHNGLDKRWFEKDDPIMEVL
jgi:hypothetical protein